MAWRTSENLVKATLLDNYNTKNNPSLASFITSANRLTNKVVTCAAAKGITLTTADLQEIEKLLSAHFYCIADPLYESRKTGGASGKFQGKTDKGLDYTPYGQQAKMFDESGCLNQFSSGRRVGMTWLGKPRSEETVYEDRN